MFKVVQIFFITDIVLIGSFGLQYAPIMETFAAKSADADDRASPTRKVTSRTARIGAPRVPLDAAETRASSV
jgi:hypothetical protein